jgi:MFS family permease
VVYGLGGMGIAVLTTVAFGTMGSTAAGMLGLGLSASAIFITATTLIQHETPHELLGRVMSCLMSLVAGSQVISMFVAGPVAEKIGIPNLYYGSAAMLVGMESASWGTSSCRRPRRRVPSAKWSAGGRPGRVSWAYVSFSLG